MSGLWVCQLVLEFFYCQEVNKLINVTLALLSQKVKKVVMQLKTGAQPEI